MLLGSAKEWRDAVADGGGSSGGGGGGDEAFTPLTLGPLWISALGSRRIPPVGTAAAVHLLDGNAFLVTVKGGLVKNRTR